MKKAETGSGGKRRRGEGEREELRAAKRRGKEEESGKQTE